MRVKLTTQSGSEYEIDTETGAWGKNGEQYHTRLVIVEVAKEEGIFPAYLHPVTDYTRVSGGYGELESIIWNRLVGSSVHLSDSKFTGLSWYTTPVMKMEFL